MTERPIQPITDKAAIAWLKELKGRVRRTQLKAAVQINSTLIEFYWELAADIVEKQNSVSWGAGCSSS
jgi:hypothetical protein